MPFKRLKLQNTIYIKQKWEKDADFLIPNDICLRQCALQWKISSSNLWRCFGL